MKGKNQYTEQEDEINNDEDFSQMIALALKDETSEKYGKNDTMKQKSKEQYHTLFSLRTIEWFSTIWQPRPRDWSKENEITIKK